MIIYLFDDWNAFCSQSIIFKTLKIHRIFRKIIQKKILKRSHMCRDVYMMNISKLLDSQRQLCFLNKSAINKHTTFSSYRNTRYIIIIWRFDWAFNWTFNQLLKRFLFDKEKELKSDQAFDDECIHLPNFSQFSFSAKTGLWWKHLKELKIAYVARGNTWESPGFEWQTHIYIESSLSSHTPFFAPGNTSENIIFRSTFSQILYGNCTKYAV